MQKLDIMKIFTNEEYKNIAAPGALAHHLQRLIQYIACKIQNGCQGAPKWLIEPGKGFFRRSRQLLQNNFFLFEHSFYEKSRQRRREKDGGEESCK